MPARCVEAALLHVLNGDATYQSLRPLALPGRALVWRDATLQGPVPRGLASDADWRERARWLAAHAGIAERDFTEGAASFRRDLASAAATEEVVLWFEEDLFCQLPLCYLLAVAKPEAAAWSVICPEEKLGMSPPDVLARRFDERRPADGALVALARRAWAAYADPDPRAVLSFVTEGAPQQWPLLARGLRLHLGRFPAPRDGLSTMQRTILANLASEGGEAAFPEHFARLARTPLFADLGVGDHDVALEWWRMSACVDPLIEIVGAAPELRPGTIESCARWTAALTATGARVMAAGREAAEDQDASPQGRVAAGDLDHLKLNPPDVWLGGVHLTRGNVWRYDAAKGTLTKD